MNRVVTFALVCCCLAVGVLRFVLPHHGLSREDVFKDMAHLFVGGLFGAALASGKRHLWTMATALTVLEVVAFFVTRR